MEIFINILAVVLLVLPVVSALAAVKLWRIARQENNRDIPALKERADAAVILALASLLGGVLAFSRLSYVTVGYTPFSSGVILVVMAGMMILTSVPNIIWLLKYKRGRFGEGP